MKNQNQFGSEAQKVKQDILNDLQSANQQGQQGSSMGTQLSNQSEAQKVRQDIQNDLQSGSQNSQNG